MKEFWKDVPNYDGSYQASTLGNIKRLHKRSDVKTHLKPYGNNKGYFVVKLYTNANGKTYSIHRLIALTFLENNENKSQVNHIDGNKANNALNNLEWCTSSENIQHAIGTGLMKNKGGDQPKLNMEIAKEIRVKYSSEPNMSKLAREYKVARTSIYKIVNYLSYNPKVYQFDV